MVQYKLVFLNILGSTVYALTFSSLTAKRWSTVMSELRFTRKNIRKFKDVSGLAVSFRLFRDDLLIVTGGINSENHIYVEDWRND